MQAAVEQDAGQGGRITVEVPSGLSGYFLATQLEVWGARVAGDDDRGWAVEIPAGAPFEVMAVVRRWLRDESLPAVRVHIDGATYATARVEADRGKRKGAVRPPASASSHLRALRVSP